MSNQPLEIHMTYEEFSQREQLTTRLADEIESLRAQLAECQKERDELMSKHMAVLEIYDQRREQLAECQKDAARYQWLRRDDLKYEQCAMLYDCYALELLDDVIDAAIRGEQR